MIQVVSPCSNNLMHRFSALLPILFCAPVAMAAVPVDIHTPANMQACSRAKQCPVAVLSPGYGFSGTDYSFITAELYRTGYLVIALHDSATGVRLDPKLPVGNQIRAMANVASQSILMALNDAAPQYPGFDWQHLLLVGHSLGGDGSAQFAADNPNRVSSLISLDNRRVALPRAANIHVLTIRASDEPPDPGVVPSEEEQRRYGTCVVHIDSARHYDMQDGGSEQLKADITSMISTFLGPGLTPQYTCARDVRMD
jgi:hypothetical protein